ncbi:glycine--tRNA ligase subunit beta [candidate division KSB1 bacterium]
MSKADFLLEIGTEEMPPGTITSALESLRLGLEDGLAAAKLNHGPVNTYGTPCRLALLVADLPRSTPPVNIKIQGPPAAKAYDQSGQPGPAALGFARKHGVQPESLQAIETDRGPYLCFVQKQPGRPTPDLLEELLPSVITSVSFHRSMRWSSDNFAFARPIRWLVCLHGSRPIPLNLGGLTAGAVSQGHKFLHPGPLRIKSASSYPADLKDRKIMVDPEDRRKLINRRSKKAARTAGGVLLTDTDLLEKVVNMVEWPGVYSGTFPADYLDLPDQVLITAMKEHQNYFSVTDDSGRLLNHFIGLHNGDSRFIDIIREGNERVLRARLADARFFYDEDRKASLEDNLEKLKGVVFLQNLGSVFDRTSRLQKLAPIVADMAGVEATVKKDTARAARLCKCDLVSLMVAEKEFSHLQGYMGGIYALASGESRPVAEAIDHHYLPRWAADRLPASTTGALLAVCDKVDILVGCFGIGLVPTGSQDPYGLRRAARGLYRILSDRDWDVDMTRLFSETAKLYRRQFEDGFPSKQDPCWAALHDFCRNRIEVQLTDLGFHYDVVRAVLPSALTSSRDTERRAEALTDYRQRENFQALAIGYRRVANIIRDYHSDAPPDPSLFKEPGERKLFEAVSRLTDPVTGDVVGRDFQAAMKKIVTLRPVIDRFFDSVLVMDKDEKIKNNRFALLNRVRSLFNLIADFSQMVVDK